jgi:4-amino-4-deoxy-L-arabinose transferase-like glycosyltransferase
MRICVFKARRIGGAVALLVLVWMLLYLPHLRTSPGWYGDETLTLMIGKSLYAGEGADRAMLATFWHPSYAYQPGYAWLVGWAAACSDGDILGGRVLNALLALAIALVMYFSGRRLFGGSPALFSALIFLSYEQSIVHFRWIYSHNAVALGLVVVVLFLMRKASLRNDVVAGLGLTLAAISHPLFIHGSLAAWVCRIKRPRSWIRMAIFPALAICGLTAWTWLRLTNKNWLFEDIATLGQFYAQFSRDNGSGFQSLKNVYVFYSQDLFHLGAILLALTCCWRRFYAIPIFLVVVSGLLLQNRQNLNTFYYQAVVFLPVLALAYAAGLRCVLVRLRAMVGRKSRVAILVACILPALLFGAAFPKSINGRITPRNQFWVTQNSEEVEAAAEWINAHVAKTDLVVCHPNIGWLLKCRTTDFMQATAWSGRSTFTFEVLPAKERFLFPADICSAKYAVIGDIDRRWTFGQPNVPWILDKLQSEKWPMKWQGENYLIIENPKNPMKAD